MSTVEGLRALCMIAERIGVSGADVTQCVATGEGLAPGLEVDAGVGVFHVPLDADVDATHAVNDRGEPSEADLDVPVDTHTRDLLDGLDEQLRPAQGVGGVDLVVAMTGDRHVAVTRQ